MSGANKFKFVSPGVQIKEIDRSQVNNLNDATGPVVIGRARRGPGMVPVKVRSYEEFVSIFGEPVRGQSDGDVWREGNLTAPTYGAWAAKAYLANSSPLTYVRLMGSEHPAATDAGQAGWKTTNTLATASATNGGAYGLFLVPSGSSVTGTLAAVFYINSGASLALVGKTPDNPSVDITGSAVMVKSIGNQYEFRMKVLTSDNPSSVATLDTSFNFDKNSEKYIRKVFNTNPTLVNTDITSTDNVEKYWLGETFADFIADKLPSASANSGQCFAFIAGLKNAAVDLADFEVPAQPAKTGWIFSQDLSSVTGSYNPNSMSKLFRFVTLGGEGSGDWSQREVKIAISNIKASPTTFDKYGTFTVEIRTTNDTDAQPQILEVFSGVNLNPNSENYIAKKIGDKYLEWTDNLATGEKAHKVLGNYDNISKFVRVEMSPLVEEGGTDPESLPFGFYGPVKYKKATLSSGSLTGNDIVKVSGSIPLVPSVSSTPVYMPGVAAGFSADLLFPEVKLRVSSSQAGVLVDRDAYYGAVTNVGTLAKLNEEFIDLVRIKPEGVDTFIADNTVTENSTIFSLDDVRQVSGSSGFVAGKYFWESGSRVSGKSLTAVSSSYKTALEKEVNKFVVPMFGGFDGLSIKEKEPFANRVLGANSEVTENYAQYSIRKAIDMVSDPEVVEMNLLAIPGITNTTITNTVLETAKNRNDTLAIIDIENGYKPTTETNDPERNRMGNVNLAVSTFKSRNLNNSFGCAYYPWVSIDAGGMPLWVPPSVVALGTMASSQEATAVWFAPAGFNRGGLSNGASGLTVLDVREKLSLKNRDALYEININPIASFPSEGIVIFGQKTLQATASALDRINVRRLAIYLKDRVAKISKGILFDPNLQVTWDRFLAQVNPLMADTKARFGLSDYKVVLDSTTTTPDLIDRNIMYAKIYIKPARAIEFIAIDFIITNTGASFDE